MTSLRKLKDNIQNNVYTNELLNIYHTKDESQKQTERYLKVVTDFERQFGSNRNIELFSAPGRTEICGNHTDHNHGKVLAASINLDAVAVASKNDKNIIKVKSENYEMDTVELTYLNALPKEKGRSASLIRGICAILKKRGYNIGGFDATTVSDVISGSGLSSSAAFEVLICTIINHLYNDGNISDIEIAKISQKAENEYFGKPCGLMDQTACSVGGFVCIDFEDTTNPVIEKIDYDFESSEHCLCIVDTGGSHSDLTNEYAAVRKEMESVANVFGKNFLRDVDYSQFNENIFKARNETGDRAVLRAIHFFEENIRVDMQREALQNGDFEQFKNLVISSGNSSYMYNQNVFSCQKPESQSVSLALALSEKILKGCGAWRVHGGGFAGTIQAFVPKSKLSIYKAEIENVFGNNSCHVLSIRDVGGVKVFG